MAETKPVEPEVPKPATNVVLNADAKPKAPPRPPNPVWRMLGLPNFRPRLPSRNWMIFLSVTGSITAAIVYDKREKRRVQKKWSKLVEHLATEPIDPQAMPRKLTVFLEPPPADGLRIAQDHFREYVKPILVASGLDWEFVQGRKEGDVRAELAEKIRKFRAPPEEASEEEDPIVRLRRQNGIPDFDGPKGDIVIGRNTWKEYIRGLHEGWLGPLTAPEKPILENQKPILENEKEKEKEEGKSVEEVETLPGITIHSTPTEGETPSTESSEKEPEKPKKPPQPAPFISTSEYSSAPFPAELPPELDPSVPISFPHILGFLNTPTRTYRYFNRRYLADQIGRETAAIILSNSRPYSTSSASDSPFSSSIDESPTSSNAESSSSEQAKALIEEEKEWHKSVHQPKEVPERTWLDDVVLDPRIAQRMRRAELSPEDEERASKIVVTEEEIEGWIKGGLRQLWRTGKTALFTPRQKHISEILQNEESSDE